MYRLPYLSSSGFGFGKYFTFTLSTLTHESPGLTHKDQGTALLVFCHYCLCYCFNLCICIYIVGWAIVTPFKLFIIVVILILYAVSFLSDILLNVVHIFVTSNQLGVLSTCGNNCRLRMLVGIQSLVAKIWKCV